MKIIKLILISLMLISTNLIAKEKKTKVRPFYQGHAVEVNHNKGYSYILVKEKNNKTFWIAIKRENVKEGSLIRFQKELVVKDFKSIGLKKVFKEIMFAVNIQHKVKK